MSSSRLLAAAALLLGLGALATGRDSVPAGGPGRIGALEVARALKTDPEGIRLIDVRSAAAYEDFHLPRAVHMRVLASSAGGEGQALTDWLEELDALGADREESIVVAGGPETPPRAAWLALRQAGYRAYYMPDALDDWLDTIVSPVGVPTDDPEEKARWDEQAELSRYFGGFPRVSAERTAATLDAATRLRRARRRGCAF